MRPLALVLALGCASAAPAAPVPGPPLEGVTVAVGVGGPVEVRLAGAWVDEEGGHGFGASATLAGPPPLTIEGARSRWNLKTGEVVFEGQVTVRRGELAMRAERVEVRYAEGRVSAATATGSVSIVRGAQRASASTVRLDGATGRLDLDGEARVVDGPNTMTGGLIVLWLDDDRVECDACRLEVAGSALDPARR
jgi:lipopolysaccharide export system protein LptA